MLVNKHGGLGEGRGVLAGKERGDCEADWSCLPVDSCQDAGLLYTQPGCHSPNGDGCHLSDHSKGSGERLL